MIGGLVATLLLLVCFLAKVSAECPNACSSHGKCGAYDMCTCYRNWISSDCSERACPFGLAHVDTPKGDLDASSGALTDTTEVVITDSQMYPYGTTEQFPAMKDSDGTVLTNSAHYYMECSNKGMCDRTTGDCACFEGYEGSSCQRASCPSTSNGVCNGHGTCKTIAELAADDGDNIYELWDADITMGCSCDAGYSGADCSQKDCKFGFDPLYYDEEPNVRYTNVTYQIYTAASSAVTGNYSIVFYDVHGEDWETDPIDIGATCDTVVAALEGLPNNVIPAGSVLCKHDGNLFTSDNVYQASTGILQASAGIPTNTYPIYSTGLYIHAKFTLAFPENAGILPEMEINKYLDGERPTLYSAEPTSTLNWHIYSNGFTGETTDYFDYCEDVTVTLVGSSSQVAVANTHFTITFPNTANQLLFQKCIGQSDEDNEGTAADIYNWDYGTSYYPHIIKLVQQDPKYTTLCASEGMSLTKQGAVPYDDSSTANVGWCQSDDQPGFYVVFYYDQSAEAFKTYTRAGVDYASTEKFYVFTTTGTLKLVSEYARAFTSITTGSLSHEFSGASLLNSYHSKTIYLSPAYKTTVTTSWYATGTTYNYFGQIDCETYDEWSGLVPSHASECVEKGDMIMLLNTGSLYDGNSLTSPALTAAIFQTNPIYPNFHNVKKMVRDNRADYESTYIFNHDHELARLKMILDTGVNTMYSDPLTADKSASVYKFIPPTGYEYAAECSNRGICDHSNGLCSCFPGYTNDNCDTQNALAV